MARAALSTNARRPGRAALAAALVALAAPVALGPGRALAAPPRPAAATQGSPRPGAVRATHVVAEGQTLGHVALRYGVTVDELQRANGLGPNQVLRAGARLAIPYRGAAAAPPPAAAKGPGVVPVSLAPASRFTAPAPGGAPRGSVRIALGAETWQGRVRAGKGKLSPQAVEGFSRILRFGPSNRRVSINPRLIEAVSAVSDHFGGRTIRVVSGYRPPSPRQHTPHSRHNVGAALDFVVEGVPNEVVRDFCRTLPNVGVGYYPNSSFVHLDARNVSAFWVDFSGPGERPRYAGPDGQDPDSHHEEGLGLDLPFGRSLLLNQAAAAPRARGGGETPRRASREMPRCASRAGGRPIADAGARPSHPVRLARAAGARWSRPEASSEGPQGAHNAPAAF
ncbi:MAG TPA: DUF882 domain-containing protein [Polyangiaceae bacterium]|nr:DUF882 domain-containing protein [Polyangiaceae bacterium]